MIKKQYVAYCAGLLDGEGSFSFIKQNKKGQHRKHGRKNPVYCGVIRIGLVCQEALNFISDTFPGSKVKREGIRKDRPNYQVMYRWEMRKRHLLISMLEKLIPYLIIKKNQAELLLETLKNWKITPNRKQGMPPEELKRLDLIYEKMKKLNAVGAKARLEQQSFEMAEKSKNLIKSSYQEIWKAIPGFEGIYAVSNLGKVKKIAGDTTEERSIKPHYYKNRNAIIHLKTGSTDYSLNLKKLIMDLFNKESLDLPIGFNNGDKKDFSVSNLYYVTEFVIEGFHAKSLPNEKWKTCPSYPELMVSSFGRVYAKAVHFKGTNNLGEETWKIKKGKVRKFDERSCSLVHIKNKRLGVNKQLKVDRLVLEAFVGSSNASVHHKNGIKNDNRLENLEYILEH